MSEGKRFNNISKKNKSNQKIVVLFFKIFFLFLFIFSCRKIMIYLINNRENKKMMSNIAVYINVNEENENKDKYDINFKELKEINNDTIGFLKVNGTDIEFIVVKGKDNSYYLHHNFEKKENVGGWIFADYKNKLNGVDKNIVIYGHNLKSGTMFSSLKNVLDKKWQDDQNNREIIFITENEKNLYQVFSVYKIKNEDYYIKTDFEERRI